MILNGKSLIGHHRAPLVQPVAGLPRGPIPAKRDVPNAVRLPGRPADVDGLNGLNGLPRRGPGSSWVCDPAEPWTLCSDTAWRERPASDYNSDPRLGELGVKSRPPAQGCCCRRVNAWRSTPRRTTLQCENGYVGGYSPSSMFYGYPLARFLPPLLFL